MHFYLGVTDNSRYHYLSVINAEDVAFWQPGGNVAFKAIPHGALAFRFVETQTGDGRALYLSDYGTSIMALEEAEFLPFPEVLLRARDTPGTLPADMSERQRQYAAGNQQDLTLQDRFYDDFSFRFSTDKRGPAFKP